MRALKSLTVLLLLVIRVGSANGALPASSAATLPARDAASFRPRANVEHLIQVKRTKDGDKLRAAMLACAQSHDELRMLTAIANDRWDNKSIETLRQCLAGDKNENAAGDRPSSQRIETSDDVGRIAAGTVEERVAAATRLEARRKKIISRLVTVLERVRPHA